MRILACLVFLSSHFWDCWWVCGVVKCSHFSKRNFLLMRLTTSLAIVRKSVNTEPCWKPSVKVSARLIWPLLKFKASSVATNLKAKSIIISDLRSPIYYVALWLRLLTFLFRNYQSTICSTSSSICHRLLIMNSKRGWFKKAKNFSRNQQRHFQWRSWWKWSIMISDGSVRSWVCRQDTRYLWRQWRW